MTAENESRQDNEKPEPEAVKEAEQQSSKGPGAILREAREAKGLNQREVADQLRLRKQIIELLEADDYSTFSTPTFIKGYLRAYAKLLDLDDTELFLAYKAKGFQEVESSQMQSFSKRKKHQENDNRLMLITYVVIIIVVGLVIWWWQEPDLGFNESASSPLQERSEVSAVNETNQTDSVGGIEISNQPVEPQIKPDEEAAVLESEVEAEDTNVAVDSLQTSSTEDDATSGDPDNNVPIDTEPAIEVAETDDSFTEMTEQAEQTNQTNTEVADALPTETEQSTTQQASQSEARSSALVLEFNEECWVKIDDASGETQAVGVKAAGYRMPVPGNAPFSVTLCKPGAVQVSFNGSAVDMTQFRAGRVARFTVPLEEQ